MAATTNGLKQPVTRFLNTLRTESTRRFYLTQLKRFFTYIEGGARVEGRTSNGPEAIAELDEKALAYFAAVRSGERSAGMDLEDFITSLPRAGMSSSTVTGAKAAVQGLFDSSEIPVSHESARSLKRRLPRAAKVVSEAVLTIDHLQKIVPLLSVRDRAVVLVMLASGARIGETLALRMGDIQLDKSPAMICFPRETAKNGKAHRSYLTEEAKSAVMAWLAIRDDYIITAARRTVGLAKAGRAKAKATDGDDRVFPFSVQVFRSGWENALKRAGLDQRCPDTGRLLMHPHLFRKFFRSQFGAVAGTDLTERLLNHTVPLGTYIQFTPEQEAQKYGECCHVLTVARGASGELTRQLSEQQTAVETLTMKNEALEAEVAALRAEVDAQREAREARELADSDPVFREALRAAMAAFRSARSS